MKDKYIFQLSELENNLCSRLAIWKYLSSARGKNFSKLVVMASMNSHLTCDSQFHVNKCLTIMKVVRNSRTWLNYSRKIWHSEILEPCSLKHNSCKWEAQTSNPTLFVSLRKVRKIIFSIGKCVLLLSMEMAARISVVSRPWWRQFHLWRLVRAAQPKEGFWVYIQIGCKIMRLT